MKIMKVGLGCAAALCFAASANAAFIIDIDTDGADDGPITYNANFAFGGDTTTASTSAKSTAVGHNQADSIFGGDGSASPDTYLGLYTPALDGDNVNLAGQALNTEGDIGGALAAGASGEYRVYATWPNTSNVSGGLTTFRLNDGVGDLFNVQLDQNTVQDEELDGAGHEWIFLGTATLDANTAYTLYQEAGTNSFVSMRASAYLFDAVPEPATAGLMGLGSMLMLSRKRR